MWNLACPDWEARLREGRPLVPDLPLFREEAEMATAFFDQLHLPDVPGTPQMREAAGDWYRHGVVAPLFGSLDPETNIRHIRELLLLVGKGNSKTTYGAATMLTALLMSRRPRAEFLLVAPTQAISDLAFAQVVGMVELDPELKKRFHVRDHLKEIVDRLSKAKLKVKTFDLNVLTGPRPAGVLVDELHLLGKHHATAKVLRQIRGGLEKMTEGFLLIITTQSDEPPAGAFKDELALARATRDGRFPGRMLPVLYEFPDAIARSQTEWQRADLWPMVMPNLGRSLRLDSLLADWEAEKAKGPHAIQTWASQHLNIEIGLGLKTDRWVGADHWEAAADDSITLDALIDRCEVIEIGVDGGGADDMLGLAVLGREAETRRWLHWGRAWVTETALQRRKSEESRFRDFAQADEIDITDQVTEANEQAADIILQIHETGLLDRVGIDMHGPTGILNALAARGLPVGLAEDSLTIGVPQGWRMSGGIKDVEVMLAERTLRHAGQAVMAYAVGNAKVEARGNAISITKQLAGAGKIDPLVALFIAAALMRGNPQPRRGRSVYDLLATAPPAQPTDDQAPIDYAVLRDTRHPLFAEMARRWEAQHPIEEDA